MQGHTLNRRDVEEFNRIVIDNIKPQQQSIDRDSIEVRIDDALTKEEELQSDRTVQILVNYLANFVIKILNQVLRMHVFTYILTYFP